MRISEWAALPGGALSAGDGAGTYDLTVTHTCPMQSGRITCVWGKPADFDTRSKSSLESGWPGDYQGNPDAWWWYGGGAPGWDDWTPFPPYVHSPVLTYDGTGSSIAAAASGKVGYSDWRSNDYEYEYNVAAVRVILPSRNEILAAAGVVTGLTPPGTGDEAYSGYIIGIAGGVAVPSSIDIHLGSTADSARASGTLTFYAAIPGGSAVLDVDYPVQTIPAPWVQIGTATYDSTAADVVCTGDLTGVVPPVDGSWTASERAELRILVVDHSKAWKDLPGGIAKNTEDVRCFTWSTSYVEMSYADSLSAQWIGGEFLSSGPDNPNGFYLGAWVHAEAAARVHKVASLGATDPVTVYDSLDLDLATVYGFTRVNGRVGLRLNVLSHEPDPG